MTIYPPVIAYSKDAFIAGSNTIKMYFSMPQLQQIDTSMKIQYKLLYQSNNTTALDNKTISDPVVWVKDGEQYYIEILASTLAKKTWEAGVIYKLQLRFYYTTSIVSEWSTVCYLKATAKPTLTILNENDGNVVVVQSPKFFGKYENTGDLSEPIDKFRFILYDTENKLVDDSGWQTHIQNTEYDSWIFPMVLSDFMQYKLQYLIRTKNGYETDTEYNFLTSFAMLEDTSGFKVIVENDYELGSPKLHITSENEVTGNIVIRRTSNKSNYTIWEDVNIFQSLNALVDKIYYDYLVENGVIYRYGVQKINKSGFRSTLVESNDVTCFFEDLFLVGNNKQLTVKFNPKITNFKRSLLESKQDTLGGKYPFILRNGDTSYFTFSLSGLISYLSDTNKTFSEKTPDVDNRTTLLTDENIYNERKFREEVEQFLTNGNVKYFKSPVEGSMLISLTNVSLSPSDQLGRMLYTFSSTAYEVGDASSLSSIFNNGISELGDYVKSEDMGTTTVSGQWIGTGMGVNYDIYAEIEKQVYQQLPTSERKLLKLTSIKITTTMSGRRFKINDVEITIGTNNIYELKDVLDITSILNTTGGASAIIDYVGEAYYVESEDDITSEDILQYVSISSLGQLQGTFSDTTGLATRDVVAATMEKYNLAKFYNFTYLNIIVTGTTTAIINGEEILITPQNSYTLKDYPVTSCVFANSTYADVNFIFNGYRER